MTFHLSTRRRLPGRLGSEDGVALVLVAIMLVVLLGGTAFIVDHGVVWLARREAQNAADAGALAGAVARAFDDDGMPPLAGGPADRAAREAAAANQVWSDAPGIEVSWPTPANCPPGGSAPAGARCVQVDVYRDGTHASETLPAYFGVLLGRTEQRVKATATAQALPANASDCLRPWAVPDKWINNMAPDETFDRYVTNGPSRGQLLPGTPDVYVPPPGGGYKGGRFAGTDWGTQVTLMWGNEAGPISNGWFLAVDIPRADGSGTSGAARYTGNIVSCNGIATHIGQFLNTETGAMVGPTRAGIQQLIAQDPGATWNTATKQIDGGCMAAGTCTYSPRIVALAVFDPDDFQLRSALNDTTPCSGGGQCVKVVNIIGFFVQDITGGGDVIGYLMQEQGEFDEGWNILPPDAAFLWSIRLVR